MAYALIAVEDYGKEPVLVATARSLKAIQKKWDKLLTNSNKFRCVGLLSEKGFTNYYDKPVKGNPIIGEVGVRMGIYYD